jgi:hypothetical protein
MGIGASIWALGALVGLLTRRFDVIDALLLFGPLVVVPLALPLLAADARPAAGTASRARTVAAAALVPAFLLPSSAIAAVFCVPWIAVTVILAGASVRGWVPRRLAPPAEHHLSVIALLWLPLAAVHMALSRAGVSYGQIRPELIELAGVHFTFAGFGATALVASLVAASTARRRAAAVVAASALVVGDSVVAIGHVSWRPVELVGTTIVASAVFLIAALSWSALPGGTLGRMFARLSGAAVLAPMAFALAYSWALTTDSAHLSYDTIAAVHGSLNAFGFVTCGLLAWHVGARPVDSPRLRGFLFDVCGLTVLFGLASGPVSLSVWSLLFCVVAAPVGAIVGLVLGLPLAAGLALALAFRPDPRRWPRAFEQAMKVAGLTAALLVVVPLNVVAMVAIQRDGDGNLVLVALGDLVFSCTAVATIGWFAGRTAARRHLQRLALEPDRLAARTAAA